MDTNLSYRNEDDRCYGATGMAVAIVVFDGEDMLSAVDLDAPTPDALVEFDPQFYFSGSPVLSAKAVWNNILKNFNLETALAIANVMSRRMVLDGEPVTADMKQILERCVTDDAQHWCELQPDETHRLFEKNYTYLYRVFNHRGVQEVIHDFARTLKRRRRMSRLDVIEQLRALSMI